MLPGIAIPCLFPLSRLYRGEHHPTDILGSLLFAALWLTAATLLIRPNSDGRAKAAPATRGGRRQPAGAAAPPATARDGQDLQDMPRRRASRPPRERRS